MIEISCYSFYDWKTIKTWLNDNARPKGCSKNQVQYLRELKGIDETLATIGVLTYFMTVRLGIQDCRAMMYSAKKQRKLVGETIKQLKVYRVAKNYDPVFRRDLDSMARRTDHVFKVCQENLRLTKHYPYFKAVGFDKLVSLAEQGKREVDEGESALMDLLMPDMERWEAAHEAEVAAHLEAIRERLEIREKWKERNKTAAKAEREAKKAAKKAESDEVKEIRENKRRDEIRRRKIEKELEATLRRVGEYKE